MRAEVYRNISDGMAVSTGHAFELKSEGYVNKTSYIENCESSSVGRALAMAGFEVRRGIASREEMEKADRMSQKETQSKMITNEQLEHFEDAVVELGLNSEDINSALERWHLTSITNATYDQAEEILNRMQKKLEAKLKQKETSA